MFQSQKQFFMNVLGNRLRQQAFSSWLICPSQFFMAKRANKIVSHQGSTETSQRKKASFSRRSKLIERPTGMQLHNFPPSVCLSQSLMEPWHTRSGPGHQKRPPTMCPVWPVDPPPTYRLEGPFTRAPVSIPEEPLKKSHIALTYGED